MFSFSFNALTEIKCCQSDTRFSGSSKFIQIGKDLVPVNRYRSFREIEGTVYRKYLSAFKYCEINNFPFSPETLMEIEPYGPEFASSILQYRKYNDIFRQKDTKHNRTYKLNKTKVRKKITALCRLDHAIKFIAFYSISFPSDADDDVLYKIFNKWLTNCRKRYGLQTYLWVAERQKNGTLHFHLLTTNKMAIRAVNNAMAIAIDNEVRSGNMTWGATSADKYNGVDVDSPQKPKRRQSETRNQYRDRLNRNSNVDRKKVISWIASYLTKYLTKNEIEFKHLPWHCSRDVSALFTSIVISDDDMENVRQYFPDEASRYKVFDKENVTIYIFLFDAPDALMTLLDNVNNFLINYVNGNDG